MSDSSWTPPARPDVGGQPEGDEAHPEGPPAAGGQRPDLTSGWVAAGPSASAGAKDRRVWGWVAGGVGLLVLIALVVGGFLIVDDEPTAAPTGQTITAPDATFEVPVGWTHQSGLERFTGQLGLPVTPEWIEAGLRDDNNFVFVAKVDLGALSVSPEEFHANLEAIEAGFKSGVEQAGATVTAGPVEVSLDGLPALDATLEYTAAGRTASTRIVTAYDGNKGFVIGCQYVDAGTEVLDACQAAVDTFHRT